MKSALAHRAKTEAMAYLCRVYGQELAPGRIVYTVPRERGATGRTLWLDVFVFDDAGEPYRITPFVARACGYLLDQRREALRAFGARGEDVARALGEAINGPDAAPLRHYSL